jgi:16S rRNA G966 N2-methylase RsmD
VSIPGLTARLSTLPTLPASILPDARDIDPPQLPPGSVVYIDPPYVNTTGYAHDLGRDAVCELAERWASAGAWVVISEAEPLAELGWHQVEITGERVGQKRTFSKQQREYLTMSQPPLWRPSEQRTLFTMAAK